MKAIRKHWKELDEYCQPFCRSDLELYAERAKDYLEVKGPGPWGLCWFADLEMGDRGKKSAYTVWNALALVQGSVASKWQKLRDTTYVEGGRTPERVAMVKALIVELEAIIEKDKRKR